MKNNAEITRQNIIDSYWKLYKTKKGKQISVKEIMEKAGYNRCTFYEYFNDTRDVLEFIEDDLIEYLKNNIISKNSIDNYVFEDILKLYDEKGEYFSILLGSNGDSAFQNKLKKAIKPFVKKRLNIDKGNTKNDVTIEFIISGLISTFEYWYKHKGEINVNEFIKITHSIMINGTIKTLMN